MKVKKITISIIVILIIVLLVVLGIKNKGVVNNSMENNYTTLVNKLDYIKDGGYVQYKISDTDSFTLLYNSKNEGILSSVNGVTVYKNNNQVVVPNSDGTFQEVMEITPLGYIELILDGVYNDGLGTVTTSEKTTKKTLIDGSTVDNKVTNYAFSIEGYDNLSKLYSKVDANFNSDAIQQYREDGIGVGLKLELYVDGNQGLGGIYKLILDGVEYTVWMFDGYSKVGNWELPSGFYTDDADYDILFKGVVTIVNNKVSYGDIMYNYRKSGSIESLDTLYNEDSYKELGKDKQLELLKEYLGVVTNFNYTDHLGILEGNALGIDTVNSKLVEYLSVNKGDISLFELYTIVMLENNWLSYGVHESH